MIHPITLRLPGNSSALVGKGEENPEGTLWGDNPREKGYPAQKGNKIMRGKRAPPSQRKGRNVESRGGSFFSKKKSGDWGKGSNKGFPTRDEKKEKRKLSFRMSTRGESPSKRSEGKKTTTRGGNRNPIWTAREDGRTSPCGKGGSRIL